MWLLIFLAALAVYVYYNVVKPLKFWEEKGIPFVKPVPIFGNMASNVFRRVSFQDLIHNLYKAFPNKRYVGVYQFLQPTLLIRDLELIKRITIKEFDVFPDHRTISSADDPLFSKNLFSLKTKDGWQDMRSTLSPSFTSSKMKAMFILMRQCADQFTDYFLKQKGTVEVEFKDVFTRYTNDVIGTTAFGVTCDSLKDRDNKFYLMGKDASNFSGLRGLKFFGYSISPTLMKLLKVSMFSSQVNTFFRKLIKETLQIREEQHIVRPDMINLLMEARKGRTQQDDGSNTIDSGFAVVEETTTGKPHKTLKASLTDDDITAQALVFFLAGFDSVANLMCLCAYELAINTDIQDRLREEVDSTMDQCKGKITYEALLNMKYLDCVVSETLRKWPIAPFLDRYSLKPFTIEAEEPGEKTLHLEAGTAIWVSVTGIHRDPAYYPDPDKFDPERFNDENKHNIKPFSYLPFGSGPRNCIGSRFALLESKLIIASILSKFEIVPIKKTPIPLVLSKKNFNPVPDEGYWLGLKPRVVS